MATTNNKPPIGLTLLCNDLGEVEQVIQDGLGLPALGEGKQGKPVFLRLVERGSLDQARAFLTDLRISHRVTDRQLSIQTKDGPLSAYFAGVKSGAQFVIVAAQTAEIRDRLYAEVLATVAEHAKHQPASQAVRPLRTRPESQKEKRPPDPERLSAELESTRKELEKTRQDLYELATLDTITGLYNRRHFIKRLREELRESERYKRSPAFLMLDIDNFRAINDRYGLQIGDEIIRSVGEVMQGVLRRVDLVGRLGGDEFGALLLETTLENSLQAAGRLQKKVSGVSIEVDGRSFHVKVSIALVFAGDGKNLTAEKVLKQAEKLLQKANESGGNQVVHE